MRDAVLTLTQIQTQTRTPYPMTLTLTRTLALALTRALTPTPTLALAPTPNPNPYHLPGARRRARPRRRAECYGFLPRTGAGRLAGDGRRPDLIHCDVQLSLLRSAFSRAVLEANLSCPNAMGGSPTLTPAAFEVMALGFADRAASHDPSWAWVPDSDDGPLSPAVGFLRSASILVPLPPLVSGDDPSPPDVGLIEESFDDDDAAAVRTSPPPHRLELHIVYSCADTCDSLRAPASCVLYVPTAQGSPLLHVRRTPASLGRAVHVPRTVAPQVYSETYRVPVLLLQGYGDGRPWRVEAVRAHLSRCARAGPASLPLEMVSQARCGQA